MGTLYNNASLSDRSQLMWALELGEHVENVKITADMIPRATKYVAIRLIRARPAPEIVVHMTTRKQSTQIVSASAATTRSGDTPSIPAWHIPGTYDVDQWLAEARLAKAQMLSGINLFNLRAPAPIQSWSHRVDHFKFRPSPYSPDNWNFLTEETVFLTQGQLADLFVTNNDSSRALVVSHGYVGHSPTPAFNASAYKWPEPQLVEVFEARGEPSSYYQTDIYASAAFDQSALQASDFPLSLSLSLTSLASPSAGGNHAVLVSFVAIERSVDMSVTVILLSLVGTLVLILGIALTVCVCRKRCASGVAIVRCGDQMEDLIPVVLEVATDADPALHPVARVCSSDTDHTEISSEDDKSMSDGDEGEREYPMATPWRGGL